MTVREKLPDLAHSMPIKTASIDALLPEAAPVHLKGASAGRVRSPLFVAAVLVYATGLLLLLAFPRSVSAWLDDFTPNPVIKVLKIGTGTLEYAADRIGISSILDSARQKFLKQIQRED